jgi:hypothetical protein
MTELLAITSQLIGCMERELELMRSMKPTELKQLQMDKVALADAYQAFTMALKECSPAGRTHRGNRTLPVGGAGQPTRPEGDAGRQ